MDFKWKMPDIFLLDINPKMTKEWEKCFANEENVQVVCEEFGIFMEKHPENISVVSPANSYGLMDGGYDEAITQFWGDFVQQKVQKKIQEQYLGEQPVATVLVVTIDTDKRVKLLHIPTMKVPEPIIDPQIIYHCMRQAIITAIMDDDIENIVIPAFGALTGRVPSEMVAKQMYAAYLQIKTQIENGNPCIGSWNTVLRQNLQILKKLKEK